MIAKPIELKKEEYMGHKIIVLVEPHGVTVANVTENSDRKYPIFRGKTVQEAKHKFYLYCKDNDLLKYHKRKE